MTDWSPEQLDRIHDAGELHIATRRPDGTLRAEVPIWVVRAGTRVYVRTWFRRDTGWYGQAVTVRRARIRVPGLEADVVVDDIGVGEERAEVDAAYHAKYGRYGPGTSDRMVGDEAAATTLALTPESAPA